MRLVKTAARNIKEAGKRRRVSVEGAHAPKLNMQNDSSVRVKWVLTANQGRREGEREKKMEVGGI